MKKTFAFLILALTVFAVSAICIDAVASISVQPVCCDLPAFFQCFEFDPAGGVALAVVGVAGVPARFNNGARPGAIQQSGPQVRSNVMIPGMRHIFSNPQVAQSMNMMPIPDSITILVASGAAGAAIRVYVLNQDLLNNITDNGSGAGSITYTYQDGFAGRLVSNLLAQDRAGMGAACFGVSMRMNVTSTGAGNPSGLNASNPYFATFNAFGNALPLNMNMSSNQTRMDQDTSIEVVPCAQNLGRFVQYSFIIPVLNTASITLYMTPNYTI